MSNAKISQDNPNLLSHNGPGNVTLTNYNVAAFYATVLKVTGTVVDGIFPICIPDDDLIKVSIIDYGVYSLKGNMNIGIRMNTLGLLYSVPHYRPQQTYLSNHQFNDYEIPPVSPILGDGTSMDGIQYSDSVHSNYIPNTSFMDLKGIGKVVFQNLTFSEVGNANFPSIKLSDINHCEFNTINIQNYNGSTSTSVPVIQLSNNLNTYTFIQDLNLQN